MNKVLKSLRIIRAKARLTYLLSPRPKGRG